MITVEELRLLVGHGEDEKTEFKEELRLTPHEARAEFIRDMIALVNSHGDRQGFLVIGVANDGVVKDIGHLGLRDENLQQSVNELVEPPIKFRYVQHDLDGKQVGCLVVDASVTRPHVVKKDFAGCLNAGDTFIRYGSSKRRPTGWDHQEFARARFQVLVPKPEIIVKVSPGALDNLSGSGWRRASQQEARRLNLPDLSYLPIVKELPLYFRLENIGSAKATDVRIAVSVPSGLTLTSFSHGDVHEPSGADVVANPSEPGVFYIKVPELMHHLPYTTKTVIKMISTTRELVTFTYKIHEPSLAEPMEGYFRIDLSVI